MGTKIQANAFFREHRPVIDLDGSTSSGIMKSLYNQNQIMRNGYFPGYDPAKVRQTILEHESIFRNQLQELHRLYGRQQELMNEIKRRGINKESRSLRNGGVGNRNDQSYDRATMLSLSSVQTAQHDADALKFNLHLKRSNHLGELSAKNSCSNLNPVTKDFFKNSSIDGMNGRSSLSILGLRNELIFDDYAGKRRFEKHSQPLKEFLNSAQDLDTSVSQRKRKLFGVEISEPETGPHHENQCAVSFQTTSWIDNSFMQNLGGTNANSCSFVKKPYTEIDQRRYFENSNGMNSEITQRHILPSDCEKKEDNPLGGLPWFRRTSQVSNDVNKEKTGLYFMNLDSLQNCSNKFFKKSETADVTFPASPQKSEIYGKIGGDGAEVLDTGEDCLKNIPKTEEIPLNKHMSDMRHQIDLNLSLDEEEDPSLPTSVLKIAPMEIEYETDASREDKIAAETMIFISQSERENPVDAGECDRLKWLAEIVSSSILPEESTIPEGMDHFEYMTLKLEDTKEEVRNYGLATVSATNPSDDENVKSKRCRRTRQRNKDFKRDILPGLVTLSRVEVTEDLQAFDELMKAKGGNTINNNLKLCTSQRGSARKCRGRMRTMAPTMPQRAKELCRPPQNQPVCQLVERSLTGWGKRTRRLPRQRCSNSILSFAVKC